MTNLNKRKEYLNSLFNVKKLSNLFVQNSPEWVNKVATAVKDFKNEWSIIPRYEKNNLDLETLLKDKKYKWLSSIQMHRYHEDIEAGKTPEQIAEEYLQGALTSAISLIDLNSEIPKKSISTKPLMALDLETTGLDVTYFKIGGKTIHTCYITGICLAYFDENFVEHSIYLPVLHTESDGVPNLGYKKAIELITLICEKFSPIYHNSTYDRDVSSLNGVVYKDIGGYFDTLNIVNQTDLKLNDYVRLGLKDLSKDVLHREQITLSMVDASKVGYHNLAYQEMEIYGISDASNTLALFKHFVDNYPDLFVEGLSVLQIDAKAIDITWNFNRRGFPADKTYMENSLKDVLRRELLLYKAFSDIMTELGCDEDIYITKLEAISRHLILVYAESFTAFVKKKTGITIDIWEDDTALQKFKLAVVEDLDIEIKIKVLKSGEFKLTHSMDVHHLSHLVGIVETVRWLDPEKAEKIVELCEVLLNVSSILQNANSYYVPFLKSLTFDDSGHYKLPVALKFSGTVTTRYSNKSGKPSSIIINRLKTKTTFGLKIDSGLSGVNAQGLPSAPYKLIEAKEILDVTALGKKIENRLKAIEVDVDEYFNDKLL
jgi:hypothetical protein